MTGQAGAANTANLIFGGQNPGGQQALAELWNGSAWTEVGDLNEARHAVFGTGSSTAAITAGGNLPPSPYSVNAEVWDGSSWTEVNNLNAKKGRSGTGGISTAALAFGGTNGPSRVTETESWDGSSWTEVADMATARSGGSGTPGTSSTSQKTFITGGGTPSLTGATEEWNAADFQIKTVTTS